MSTYDERDAALAVACDHCEANPGSPCFNELGSDVESVHQERIDALKEYIREARGDYDQQGVNP